MATNPEEYGFPMPPVSWGALEAYAEILAEDLFPYSLEQPTAIDVKKLMNKTLPIFGISVYPVAHEELPGEYAVTEPTTNPDEHTILLRQDLFDEIDLYGQNSSANLAKATLFHEMGHALLNHDLRLGRLQQRPKRELLLARKTTDKIKPYEDAERQAWCLAGCLAMPRRTIVMIPEPNIYKLSLVYQLSTQFVSSHLRRMGIIMPEFGEL